MLKSILFYTMLWTAVVCKSVEEYRLKAKARHQKFNKAMENWENQYNGDWEPHEVVTDDGYIVTVYSLSSLSSDGKSKGSILMQGGFWTDAANWLLTQDQSVNRPLPLPLRLCQAGYEVWLENSRGLPHSVRHTSSTHRFLDNESPYWDFSLME